MAGDGRLARQVMLKLSNDPYWKSSFKKSWRVLKYWFRVQNTSSEKAFALVIQLMNWTLSGSISKG